MEQDINYNSKKLDFKSNILPEDLNQRLKMVYDKFENKPLEAQDLLKYIEELHNEDFLIQYHGLVGLRKHLSVEENPPIAFAIQHKAIPVLISIIKTALTPYHVHEACWSLTNIASGSYEETESVVSGGGIRIFVKLVNSDILEIADQAIWALGNIAGDNPQFRDMVLYAQGHKAIIIFAEKNKHIKKSFKQCVWALSNLCRGTPAPEFEKVKVAILFFCYAIQLIQEPETVIDALWALSYLTNKEEGQRMICEIQTLKRLTQFLSQNQMGMLVPALRTLGNVATGDEDMTQYVIDSGILQQSPQLLKHTKKVIRKETCWLLSNIAAGCQNQGRQLLQSQENMELLSQIALNDLDDVRIEAIYTFANLTSQLDFEGFHNLIKYKFFEICKISIPQGSVKLLTIILEAIESIIKNISLDSLEVFQEEIVQILDQIYFQASSNDMKGHIARTLSVRANFQNGLIQNQKKN